MNMNLINTSFNLLRKPILSSVWLEIYFSNKYIIRLKRKHA
jgi:hypothetical protein